MKGVLKAIAVVLVLVAVTGIAVFTLYLPRRQPAADIHVELTPENIARGRYLAVNVLQCVDCHSERDWNLYGGPPVEPLGAGRACMTRQTRAAGVNAGQDNFPGTLCIRNITPDVATGIGAWTDGEIVRAVRDGVTPDNKGLFPIMPYFIYRNLADQDIQAVVAYLRSMQPVSSVRPQRDIDFPLSMMVHFWPRPVTEPVPLPDQANSVVYGEYLSVVARCDFCHTPKDPNSMEGFPGRRLAGGMPFFLNGRVLYPMNLTSHESGLGSWTRAQFIARFREFSEPTPASPEMNTLMNWNAFSGMTDADLNALYDFFMTLPPVPTQREEI